ncbi:MAG: putative toxin-antitoxin system toxin component, PIN family [Candidatus Saccharimonadales bacterium]
MVKNSAKRLATNRRKRWQDLLQNNAVPTASGKRKVLIDTNVWYSAILYGGKPEELVRLCINSQYIVISAFIINEIRVKLKLDVSAPYKWLNTLERQLKRVCEVVDVDVIPKLVRDPKDDPIIATGIGGQCKYLITGDGDLLSLKSVGNLQIITVDEFLRLVQ